MEYTIIAPHADDELIGCFELLETGHVRCVAFPTLTAMAEAQFCAKHYGFKCVLTEDLLSKQLPTHNFGYLFPDPINDFHPLHKQLGAESYKLRESLRHIFYYTTNMNAPYLREVRNPIKKRDALNMFYSQKKSLWLSDHRYFLFEGQIKLINTWQD